MFCRMSPGRTPTMYRQRAMSPAQVSMSFLVYRTAVGEPVVPLEACTRISFSTGSTHRP